MDYDELSLQISLSSPWNYDDLLQRSFILYVNVPRNYDLLSFLVTQNKNSLRQVYQLSPNQGPPNKGTPNNGPPNKGPQTILQISKHLLKNLTFMKSNIATQNSHFWKEIHLPNHHFWYLC